MMSSIEITTLKKDPCVITRQIGMIINSMDCPRDAALVIYERWNSNAWQGWSVCDIWNMTNSVDSFGATSVRLHGIILDDIAGNGKAVKRFLLETNGGAR